MFHRLLALHQDSKHACEGLVMVIFLDVSLTLGCLLLIFLCLLCGGCSGAIKWFGAFIYHIFQWGGANLHWLSLNALYATGVFICGCGVEGF